MAEVVIPPARHDIKRKQNLAYGRITDNAGKVTVTLNEDFDLSNTIFKTIPQILKSASAYQRWKISIFILKLDLKYTWNEAVAAAVEADYTKVQKSLADDTAIFKFMLTECEFAAEHAEGHFLDHLHFCREYSALHFTKAATSPRVMLLHSIMGLATNLFPMKKEKMPALQSLVSAEDFQQIECFPSFVRMMVHGKLLVELAKYDFNTLDRIRKIRFHRVIDNKVLELSADQMWEALNYQLIHTIDFLPVCAWKRTSGSYFFHIFIELHQILTRAGQLRADVGWHQSWMQPRVKGSQPNTWRHYFIELVPRWYVTKIASNNITRFSGALGHSLEYVLEFEGKAPKRSGRVVQLAVDPTDQDLSKRVSNPHL